MRFNSYDVGDLVRMSSVFYDDDGNLADPSTITLKVKDIAGTVSTYVFGVAAEVVRDKLGHYHADIEIDGAGDGFWFFRWEGIGAIIAAEERKIQIRKKNV